MQSVRIKRIQKLEVYPNSVFCAKAEVMWVLQIILFTIRLCGSEITNIFCFFVVPQWRMEKKMYEPRGQTRKKVPDEKKVKYFPIKPFLNVTPKVKVPYLHFRLEEQQKPKGGLGRKNKNNSNPWVGTELENRLKPHTRSVYWSSWRRSLQPVWEGRGFLPGIRSGHS